MPRPRKGIRLLQKAGGYILRYRDDHGSLCERRLAAKNYDDAKREEAAFVLSGSAEPRLNAPANPQHYPIATALNLYAIEHGINTSNPERIASAIERLAPYWGSRVVDDIRPQICRDYASQRRKQVDRRCKNKDPKTISDSTIRRELVVLRAAINHAWKEGRITRAPYVWLPAEGASKNRWLSRTEVAQLLFAARTAQGKDYLPRFILLALYTAARKMAILTLKWDQIDFQKGIINLNPEGRVQTSKGRAKIIAPPTIMWFLRRWYRRRSSDYVIEEHGKPIGDIKVGFKNAVIRSGLKDVTPHTLRHTAATWMRREGVSIELIAQYLGQSIERTTERYAHFSPDWLKDAAMALERPKKDKNRGFSGGFSGG